MVKNIICIASLTLFLALGPVWAAQTSQHSEHSRSAASDHSTMDHGSKDKDGKFVHTEMVNDIHAEFQVMDLASMNIKDPEGKTHHVMVTFLKNDKKIEKAVGKVKVISPSGKEQLGTLKDFGNGIFAVNFTFDEPGKWGLVCLFKEKNKTHTIKFWYPHK